MEYFIFKRKDGLEVPSFSLGSIVEKPFITRATRVFKHIQIEGRNGTLTEDTKAYNNIEISVSLINYKEDLWENEAISLFDGTGGELSFTWIRGSYKVKEVSVFNITEEITGIFRIELTFICEPFRHLETTEISIDENDTTFLVEGNIETDHILTVYGTGDISLFINDEQIVFSDVVDHISIDTYKMSCYKDNQSTNEQMTGEFIKLQSGENTISWIGTVTQIDMSYRGRFLN